MMEAVVRYYSLDQIAELLQQGFPASDALESGFPWHSSLGELKARYGVRSWRNFHDAIFLPEPSLHLTSFHHLYRPGSDSALVSCFSGEFNELGDFRRNHARAIQLLTSELGRGPEIADVSNCLEAVWPLGLLQVKVYSFIREKTISTTNQLYLAHPDLWHSSLLYVEAIGCADRRPCSALRDLAAMPHVLRIDPELARIGAGNLQYNRLLPAPLDLGRGYIAWSDGDARLGLANRVASIVLDVGLTKELLLEERTPARGAGDTKLYLKTKAGESLELLTLMDRGRAAEFDSLALRMSRLFRLSLTKDSFPDE